MDSAEVIRRCGLLAELKEEAGRTTHGYLSPTMHEIHRLLRGWMEEAGLETRVDAAGNLRGVRGRGPRMMVGSHIDAVARGGALEGVLGVLLAIALAEQQPPCAVEVAAFAGADGVGCGAPFIGSRAVIGSPVREAPVLAAMREFGLDPALLPDAVLDPEVKGYLEFQVEQGPVLECLGVPLGAVEAMAGFSRWMLRFGGEAQHAGSTPMERRRDALAGAAEWIGLVEHVGQTTPGLAAAVDRVEVQPGAPGVIPGKVRVGLDLRHGLDEVRERAREILLDGAEQIAERRGLTVEAESRVEEPAAALHWEMVEAALKAAGCPVRRLIGGGSHDAMILARKVPASMVLLRSPGGNSGETVRGADVEAALAVGKQLLGAWRPGEIYPADFW